MKYAILHPAALLLPRTFVSRTDSFTAADMGTCIYLAWANPLRSTARTGASSLATGFLV